MTFQEITETITSHFPQLKLDGDLRGPQPILVLPAEAIFEVCEFLHQDDRLFFDYLACITGIDNGPGLNTMELIYNLTSIPYGHDLMIKLVLPRNTHDEPLPVVSTVSSIWRTANWHEREIYDLVGISFEGHPDQRRILLPEDWEGHPLRRDYVVQERYHGIYTKYDDGPRLE